VVRQTFNALGASYSFAYVDVFNSFYNPRGKMFAPKFKFPVPERSFDIAFATSVFTHMQAAEVEHYVAETAKALKPGGIFYFTLFGIDEHSENAIAQGQAAYRFPIVKGRGLIENRSEVDRSVAYEVLWITNLLKANAMSLEKMERGNWRGQATREFQDIIVARKQN
jgi:SAM-dependent methyltransferase